MFSKFCLSTSKDIQRVTTGNRNKRSGQVNLSFKLNRVNGVRAVRARTKGCGFRICARSLEWKTLLHDEKEKSFSGPYLFEEEASVKAYLDDEIVTGILSHPALSDNDTKSLMFYLNTRKLHEPPFHTILLRACTVLLLRRQVPII